MIIILWELNLIVFVIWILIGILTYVVIHVIIGSTFHIQPVSKTILEGKRRVIFLNH